MRRCFVGEYDPTSGRLHYVNAGHEPPFVLRKSGRHFQTVFLESGGPVIGMLRDSSYREGVVTLRPRRRVGGVHRRLVRDQ